MEGGKDCRMIGKFLGGVLIIGGCSFFGFSICAGIKREEHTLRLLINILDYMQCELQYRMTPLPDLCRQVGLEHRNIIGKFFADLSVELESKISSDVSCCISNLISLYSDLPPRSKKALQIFGASLGRFDEEGQIRSLEAVRAFCRTEIENLAVNRDARLRSYQTLGVCAGAALAILFV